MSTRFNSILEQKQPPCKVFVPLPWIALANRSSFPLIGPGLARLVRYGQYASMTKTHRIKTWSSW